jgi:hypothetical protein
VFGQAERYDSEGADNAVSRGDHAHLVGRAIRPRGVPMFRISQGQGWLIDVRTTRQIGLLLRTRKRGRYDIGEISVDPLPSGHTARRWGVRIKQTGGSLVIVLNPRRT